MIYLFIYLFMHLFIYLGMPFSLMSTFLLLHEYLNLSIPLMAHKYELVIDIYVHVVSS